MIKTKQTKENIRETFVTGLSGIIQTTGYRKMFFSNWITYWPLILAVLFCLATYYMQIKALKVVLEVKAVMLAFLPGILGFTIAGYSMMVAFIHSGMLDKITEPVKDSKFSLYQKMSATLATNILMQGIALVIAYIAHFISYFDTNKATKNLLPDQVLSWINYFGILLLSYWFCISLFMIVQIILNIFGFSQLHHYFVNKAKVDALDAEEQ